MSSVCVRCGEMWALIALHVATPSYLLQSVRSAHSLRPYITRASVRCCDVPLADAAADADGAALPSVALSTEGGLTKSVIRPAADESSETPVWGAMVSVRFVGRFPNGTVFDDAFAEKPYEFQLNTGTVVDGMERGVRSMRTGERARLRCEPRWAYGTKGVGSHIPPNATLLYDVELIEWRAGLPVENDSFDVDTYKKALEGKAASSGTAKAYTWSEGGEEVTLWLPLHEGEGARDVTCDIRPTKLSVRVGAPDTVDSRLVEGQLKGRAVPDESYWVLDEEHPVHGRALQVVLAKAGAYVRWDGVLIADDDRPDDW